jgi:hypothetical protein
LVVELADHFQQLAQQGHPVAVVAEIMVLA